MARRHLGQSPRSAHQVQLALAAVLASGLLLIPLAAQQRDALPVRYTAVAVSTGGPVSGSVASRVEITINRWSTAGESERLMKILKEKGPEALLDTLRETRSVGTINTPGNLAYDLHFALQEPGEDGGQRIVLATDRPISFWEAANRPRTIDYPFTFIELRLDRNGEGQGKLALATKIIVSRDGKTVQLENYEAQPIHLNEVRRAS